MSKTGRRGVSVCGQGGSCGGRVWPWQRDAVGSMEQGSQDLQAVQRQGPEGLGWGQCEARLPLFRVRPQQRGSWEPRPCSPRDRTGWPLGDAEVEGWGDGAQARVPPALGPPMTQASPVHGVYCNSSRGLCATAGRAPGTEKSPCSCWQDQSEALVLWGELLVTTRGCAQATVGSGGLS